MIKISTVLHPTDFSEVARHALPYAVEFARVYSAKLVLIHVLDLPFSAISMADEAMKEAEQKLNSLVPQKIQEQIDLVELVVRGTPCEEITAAAKEYGADIIVMATHGAGGWRHALMGDVAEKVVRNAPCPVLTIRHPEHEFLVPDEAGSESLDQGESAS